MRRLECLQGHVSENLNSTEKVLPPPSEDLASLHQTTQMTRILNFNLVCQILSPWRGGQFDSTPLDRFSARKDPIASKRKVATDCPCDAQNPHSLQPNEFLMRDATVYIMRRAARAEICPDETNANSFVFDRGKLLPTVQSLLTSRLHICLNHVHGGPDTSET